jgi:hypothetical protein
MDIPNVTSVVVASAVAVGSAGGWLYERSNSNTSNATSQVVSTEARLSTLEAGVAHNEKNIIDIREGIHRIEDILIRQYGE